MNSNTLDGLAQRLAAIDLNVSDDEGYTRKMVRDSKKQAKEVITELGTSCRFNYRFEKKGIIEIRHFISGYIEGLFIHSNLIAPHAIAIECEFNKFLDQFA